MKRRFPGLHQTVESESVADGVYLVRVEQVITASGCVIKPQPQSPPVRLEPDLYTQLWTEVLRRDGWRCQACGARTNLQVHHIQKRSQGGQDMNENLITLCTKCHRVQHGRETNA